MCGLFGFLNYSGKNIQNLKELTNALAEQTAERGTDATGIAFNGKGWWDYGRGYTASALLMDDDDYGYIDDLKAVAQCQGYSSEEIDCLLEDGFSPFVIEEFLYEY